MDVSKALYGARILSLADINDASVTALSKQLIELNLESSDEIRLIIESRGGETRAALSFCDSMTTLRAPVTGVIFNYCRSAAIFVLQGCKKRLALQNADCLLHFTATSGIVINARDSDEVLRGMFERRLAELRDLQSRADKLIARRTGLSLEKVAELTLQGEFQDAKLTSQEAKELNLIDDIIDDPKDFFDKAYSN
jgi:ATP-dependent protease ClpP protease subunit